MDLDELRSICSNVVNKFTKKNLKKFAEALDHVPQLMANFSASYYSKLLSICATGIFTTMGCIFKNKIDHDTQLKILKFWDILIETCNSESELRILFTGNAINNLILYPFEFSGEILQSYITVLKVVSMKANLIDPNLLFTTDMAECPLITHSVPFVVHHDSVVVSGARLVILNLCALNNDSINQAIMETFTDAPLDCLLQSIHQDELAFLADLLDVAPDPLSQVVMTKLTKALETENNITFCRSVLFLSFGQMRPLMITLIEKRIPLLPQKHILTLSLLQFCCENNLIDVNSLPQTIKSDVFEVFKSRRTFTEFSVSLQLIGLFSKQPPKIVIEVNNELIEEIRKLSPIILMPLLLKIRLLYKPRYDLEAIIENESERNSITQETLLFLQLNEIQFFLNHQNIDNIFVLTAQKNDVVQSYGIIGGGMLRISSDLLIDSNGNVYKLSKLCLKEEEKRALQTSVKMLYVKESESIVKPAITQKLEFNFPSQFVCLAFKAELCKRQTAMINEMLNRLKK